MPPSMGQHPHPPTASESESASSSSRPTLLHHHSCDWSSSEMLLQSKLSSFESAVRAPLVDKTKLRHLAWNGVPPGAERYRAATWKILCDYLPAASTRRASAIRRKRREYRTFAAGCYDSALTCPRHADTLRQVRLDVPRTAPHVALFRHPRVRNCLERVLYAWAVRHPAASYVQGINDLATPLLAVFLADRCFHGDLNALLSIDEHATPLAGGSGSGGGGGGTRTRTRTRRVNKNKCGDDEKSRAAVMDMLVSQASREDLDAVEADCFWCLTSLLGGIQDHYTPDQPGLQRMVQRLDEYVLRMDPDLHRHLTEVGVEFVHFAYRWMNCLLLREIGGFGCIVRMWDTYLAEGGHGNNNNKNGSGRQGNGNAFDDFHVYVCAALLDRFGEEAKSRHDFDDLFYFLQNLPTDGWTERDVELLLSEAFVIRSAFCSKDVVGDGDGAGGGGLDFEASVARVVENEPSKAGNKLSLLFARRRRPSGIKADEQRATTTTYFFGNTSTVAPAPATAECTPTANMMYDVDFLCV